MPAFAGRTFAHDGLADVDAELEEFTVDAGSAAPTRILAAHPPNQFTDFLRHRWAAGLAAADFPSPEQSKSLAVSRDDGIRFDDAQSRAPFGPGSTKPGPQAPVESIQLRLLHRTLQHAKLVAEGDDLKLQCRSSTKNRQRGGEQCR